MVSIADDDKITGFVRASEVESTACSMYLDVVASVFEDAGAEWCLCYVIDGG